MLLDFEIKNELCLAMDVAQMLTSDLSLPPTVQPVPNDVYDGPAVDFSVRTHLLILALVLVGGQMEVGVWAQRHCSLLQSKSSCKTAIKLLMIQAPKCCFRVGFILHFNRPL